MNQLSALHKKHMRTVFDDQLNDEHDIEILSQSITAVWKMIAQEASVSHSGH